MSSDNIFENINFICSIAKFLDTTDFENLSLLNSSCNEAYTYYCDYNWKNIVSGHKNIDEIDFDIMPRKIVMKFITYDKKYLLKSYNPIENEDIELLVDLGYLFNCAFGNHKRTIKNIFSSRDHDLIEYSYSKILYLRTGYLARFINNHNIDWEVANMLLDKGVPSFPRQSWYQSNFETLIYRATEMGDEKTFDKIIKNLSNSLPNFYFLIKYSINEKITEKLRKLTLKYKNIKNASHIIRLILNRDSEKLKKHTEKINQINEDTKDYPLNIALLLHLFEEAKILISQKAKFLKEIDGFKFDNEIRNFLHPYLTDLQKIECGDFENASFDNVILNQNLAKYLENKCLLNLANTDILIEKGIGKVLLEKTNNIDLIEYLVMKGISPDDINFDHMFSQYREKDILRLISLNIYPVQHWEKYDRWSIDLQKCMINGLIEEKISPVPFLYMYLSNKILDYLKQINFNGQDRDGITLLDYIENIPRSIEHYIKRETYLYHDTKKGTSVYSNYHNSINPVIFIIENKFFYFCELLKWIKVEKVELIRVCDKHGRKNFIKYLNENY